MSSADNSDPQTPTIPASKKPKIPWRAFRILAGLLTIYIGLQIAIVIDLFIRFAGAMSGPLGPFGPLMSGGGADVESKGYIIYWATILLFLIGGILFCGKKGRGHIVVWLAALLSVPTIIVRDALIYLQTLGYVGGDDYLAYAIAGLISLYLIWVVLKKMPPKEVRKFSKQGFAKAAAGVAVVLMVYLAVSYIKFKEPDLIESMRMGEYAEVTTQLEEGADPNTQSKSGTTALMLALFLPDQGRIAIELLEAGADPNVTSILPPEMFRTGANRNSTQPTDWLHTPSNVAIRRGYEDVALLMFENGADVRAEMANPQEVEILNLATLENPNYEFIAALIEKGVPVPPDILVEGRATKSGSYELLTLLIEHGADVNAPEGTFETPLMGAVKLWDIEYAQFLLDHGADPRQKSGGETPLEWIEGTISRSEGFGFGPIEQNLAMIRFLEAAMAE